VFFDQPIHKGLGDLRADAVIPEKTAFDKEYAFHGRPP
jgi:hypothetical protein